MVYKLIGIRLQREVSLQYDSIKNDVNSLQEAEVGDLLFFTNNVERIVHVGILIQSGYLIHAYGKVRVDRIEPEGIYDVDTQKITHSLYAIKRILDDDEKKLTK